MEIMGVTIRSETIPVTISIDGAALKLVVSFRYPESLVSEEGRCDAEIRARIGMAKANFGSMRKVLTNFSLDRHTANNETAEMLRIVLAYLRLRELEFTIIIVEVIGGQWS